MSKPTNATARALKSAANLEQVYGAGSRTETPEHLANSMVKIEKESAEFIDETTALSTMYGFPIYDGISPLQKIRESVGMHRRFMRPSVAAIFERTVDAIEEIRFLSMPRLTPGILNLVDTIHDEGSIDRDKTATIANEYLSEELSEQRLLYEFSRGVGYKSDLRRAKNVDYEDLDFGAAIAYALSNVFTPDFLEVDPTNSAYSLSPFGSAAREISHVASQAGEPLC